MNMSFLNNQFQVPNFLLNKPQTPMFNPFQMPNQNNSILSSLLNNSYVLFIPNQTLLSDENKLLTLMNTLSKSNQEPQNQDDLTTKHQSQKSESEKSPKENNEKTQVSECPEYLCKKRKKATRVVDSCPHTNLPHYAKGMCSNCYHTRGRNKAPWKCPHTEKFHYALGLCQNCYQYTYNKKNGKDEGDEESSKKQEDLNENQGEQKEHTENTPVTVEEVVKEEEPKEQEN